MINPQLVELVMPHYDSPIGSKKFAATPLKEFEISDESGYMEEPVNPTPPSKQRTVAVPNEDELRAFQSHLQIQDEPAELEKQIRQAKEMRRSGKERLNEGAKRRIEMLVGMTRTIREVVIGENAFVLQTLKGKEMREAMTSAAEFDGTIQASFEIRRQLLGRSLKQVAGVDIESFVNSSELSARLNFIDEQDDALLNRLYSEYLLMTKEADEKFAIKTEKDAKEVIDDLKK